MNKSPIRHPFLSETGILFPVLFLGAIGIIMVYSASAAISQKEYQTLFFFVKKQALFFGIGLLIMYVAASFPFHLYQSFAYLILILTLGLLAAVQIPALKHSAGGADRWLNLGVINIQPSELAKLSLILFMGYSLAKKQEMIQKAAIGFTPHLIVLGLFSVLIFLQNDLGTIIILGTICWGMMFVAGVKKRYLIYTVLLFAPPVFYFFIYHVPHRLARWKVFLNPWADPTGIGYQMVNSLKSIGDGGFLGKGIGMGIMKLHYLPEPHTDFIFSVIGEETGLLGMLVVIFLFAVLIWKGFCIARDCKSRFGAFVATGITLFIGTQALVNMGGALSMIPSKGLTLPFISYGGSSLITCLTAMGILMNISAKKDMEDPHDQKE